MHSETLGKPASISSLRAVFVGVARNCAPFLPNVLANIARFAAHYRYAAYVFVVGDSSDQTIPILRSWLAHEREGIVVDQGRLEDIEPRRTVRIAAARNTCLDLVRDIYRDSDHLIVCDLDDVLAAQVSAREFRRAAAWLEGQQSRACVSANAAPRYYDVWALRHEYWCPYDCWHAIWDRSPHASFDVAKYLHVYRRQIRIPADAAPIRVKSAFGGLAIYKLKFAVAASYKGLNAAGREQAEHIAFHEAIAAQGGESFVFPSLMVQAPQEHLFDADSASWRLKLSMLGHDLLECWRPKWTSLYRNDRSIAF